jgi:hypothetical protein
MSRLALSKQLRNILLSLTCWQNGRNTNYRDGTKTQEEIHDITDYKHIHIVTDDDDIYWVQSIPSFWVSFTINPRLSRCYPMSVKCSYIDQIRLTSNSNIQNFEFSYTRSTNSANCIVTLIVTFLNYLFSNYRLRKNRETFQPASRVIINGHDVNRDMFHGSGFLLWLRTCIKLGLIHY